MKNKTQKHGTVGKNQIGTINIKSIIKFDKEIFEMNKTEFDSFS